MGKNNRAKKKSHATKKSTAQVSSYKHFLNDTRNQPQDTIGLQNHNLAGTDYLLSDDHPNPKVPKPRPLPIKVRIKRFFDANGIWAVIITFIITFAAWTVNQIHQNDLSIAEMSVKLDYMERIVDELNSAGIDTLTLEEELLELESEIELGWKLDINSIENRISIIETEIDLILADVTK